MRSLGKIYREGDGVEKDAAEALKWYSLLAKEGDGEAQFIVGEMYLAGEGTEADRDAAINWFRLAAEYDYDPALEKLKELGVEE